MAELSSYVFSALRKGEIGRRSTKFSTGPCAKEAQ